MQVGQSRFGMLTLNQSLLSLVQRRLIAVDEALARSAELDELRTMMINAGISVANPAANREAAAAAAASRKP
jgi:twitching motility protein PilT